MYFHLFVAWKTTTLSIKKEGVDANVNNVSTADSFNEDVIKNVAVMDNMGTDMVTDGKINDHAAIVVVVSTVTTMVKQNPDIAKLGTKDLFESISV